MATNRDFTLQRHNGTDIDTLYPTTVWGQVLDKPATFTATAHNHNASDVNAGTLHVDRIPTLAQSKVTNLTTDLALKALKTDSMYFVNGTGTVAGTWLGTIEGLTAYYDGLTIRYRIPIAGASPTTLNINGLGAVTVQRYVGSSNITTHFAANAVITMTKVGASWVVQDWYDSTDDYGMRWINSVIAGVEITGYKIIMEGNDGKFYPLTIGNTTALTKTVATNGFKLDGQILQFGYSNTIAINGIVSSYGLWSQRYVSGQVHYTFNQSSGFTAYYPVFLKGTIQSDGTFKLDNTTLTSWLTQTLPTTDDGFVYIRLGYMHDTTTAFTLTIDHPMYQYKNGKLRVYETNDARPALDVYAWAKAATKPVYTAAEVGARASTWVPSWSEVTGKPTTFAPIIGSGAGDAVAGNDVRLTNARVASDVYAWAKAATKPSYAWSEIGSKPTTFAPIIGAGAAEAVAGNDVRLTNARPASDVSAWAKAANKPLYNQDEISEGTTYKRVTETEKNIWNFKAELTDIEAQIGTYDTNIVSPGLNARVAANVAITAGTKAKITYDTKGLVTGGADLVATDIPVLDTAKITTGIFADARIPSLNASKITAGAFHVDRIPTLLPAKITQDASNRFVTDTEKNTWNGKISEVPNDHVTNARLANMAANTIKGAISAGDPVDLTPAQVKTMLAMGLTTTYLGARTTIGTSTIANIANHSMFYVMMHIAWGDGYRNMTGVLFKAVGATSISVYDGTNGTECVVEVSVNGSNQLVVSDGGVMPLSMLSGFSDLEIYLYGVNIA